MLKLMVRNSFQPDPGFLSTLVHSVLKCQVLSEEPLFVSNSTSTSSGPESSAYRISNLAEVVAADKNPTRLSSPTCRDLEARPEALDRGIELPGVSASIQIGNGGGLGGSVSSIQKSYSIASMHSIKVMDRECFPCDN